ncbi:hypothetical protein D9M68_751480 [compost metagenome]
MGEHEDLGAREREALRRALGGKRGLAVERRDLRGTQVRTVGAPGEQDAEFFKALADGGDGLRQVQVALCRAAGGLAVRLRVGSVDATAGEHVGAGREARRHGAACHQHFDARVGGVGAVAQQQHGGGGAQGSGRADGVQELG